jgi:hypothetical protein
MAMLGRRDAPTFYNILDKDGRVVATVAKSKALAEKRKFQEKTGEPHTIELAGK